MNKPWRWSEISRHKNLTWDIVLNNLDKPWDWSMLSTNPYIFKLTPQKIKEYFAAKKIYQYWFTCNTNPEYVICRKRLLKEFTILKN